MFGWKRNRSRTWNKCVLQYPFVLIILQVLVIWFKNSTMEARHTKMSQLIVQIYKLSRTALTKARVVKVNHDLLHIALQVNQSQISCVNLREKTAWHPRVVRDAMHSGKNGAVHSGSMQCILVKSDEFENSYSFLYILFKSWLCCCSLATQQV